MNLQTLQDHVGDIWNASAQKKQSGKVLRGNSSLIVEQNISRPVAGEINATLIAEQGVNQRESHLSYEETQRDSNARQLEVPLFHGDKPCGWLLRAERYFYINRISKKQEGVIEDCLFGGSSVGMVTMEGSPVIIFMLGKVQAGSEEKVLTIARQNTSPRTHGALTKGHCGLTPMLI